MSNCKITVSIVRYSAQHCSDRTQYRRCSVRRFKLPQSESDDVKLAVVTSIASYPYRVPSVAQDAFICWEPRPVLTVAFRTSCKCIYLLTHLPSWSVVLNLATVPSWYTLSAQHLRLLKMSNRQIHRRVIILFFTDRERKPNVHAIRDYYPICVSDDVMLFKSAATRAVYKHQLQVRAKDRQ